MEPVTILGKIWAYCAIPATHLSICSCRSFSPTSESHLCLWTLVTFPLLSSPPTSRAPNLASVYGTHLHTGPIYLVSDPGCPVCLLPHPLTPVCPIPPLVNVLALHVTADPDLASTLTCSVTASDSSWPHY